MYVKIDNLIFRLTGIEKKFQGVIKEIRKWMRRQVEQRTGKMDGRMNKKKMNKL